MGKTLQEAKIMYKEELLHITHKHLREYCVTQFKQKAVGQDIQEFETLLRDGISKKYKDFKQEFA